MILSRVLTFFLVISILANTPAFGQGAPQPIPSTVENLQKAYPGAKIKVVSMAEFQQLEAQVKKESAPEKDKGWGECGYYDSVFYSNSQYGQQENSLNHGPKAKEPNFNFNGDFSFKGEKDFLVIVAVIGVVVVAALVIYAGAYLYHSFKNNLQCLAWNEWGYRYTSIFDDSDTQVRDGSLKGAYYSRGYFIPSGVMGLTVEAGHFKMDLGVNGTAEVRNYSGPYFLIGPTFTFPITTLDRQYFSIELLGGTTSEKKIGLMSTLRFSLGINFTKRFSISVGTGAAFVKVKEFESYLGHYDDLNFMTGFKSTVRF